MKKSPLAPNVPLSFLAQKTEGFSGADIENLCQIACKAAIRDAIAAEELKVGAEGDAMMEDDYVYEITRKHFEEAMSGARRSVTMSDLGKYDNFRMKFDPIYKQSSGQGDVVSIQWPEDGNQFAAAAADDDDDLYS